MVKLASVVMALPNLFWLQSDCGNTEVTAISRTMVVVVVVVYVIGW